jgi:hypothetical protein
MVSIASANMILTLGGLEDPREFDEPLLWIYFIGRMTLNLDGDGAICTRGREIDVELGCRGLVGG